MSFPKTQIPDLDFGFAMRNDLLTFIHYAFQQVNPATPFVESPYLALLAAKLEACAEGRIKRLIICLPPRSLKSIAVSVAFPAWLLGRFPHKQIICASYGQDLADKHARDTRRVMLSRGYEDAFSTRLSREKAATADFMTTRGGFRMATSVGGTLTGRGADVLIIDDPLKPQEALSDSARKSVNEWYDGTVLSRLNNKQEGVIIIVMQRLHQYDLVGHVLEKHGWDIVRLPAIAEADERLAAQSLMGPVRYSRKAGQLLDPERDSLEELARLRSSMGTYSFEAQYQQNPQPPGGSIIKTKWLCRYNPFDIPQAFTYKIQSWDTANKSGELHDYSVCTTWGVLNKLYFLLDVFRRKLEYPDLLRAVQDQRTKHRPRTVVIEDRGSGTQLLQDLKRKGVPVRAYSPPHGADKLMRLTAQSAAFEAGKVYLPTSAPWLDEFLHELTSFPGTQYDDQVDSTTQALDYLQTTPQYLSGVFELQI